jgi:hypothetical protein
MDIPVAASEELLEGKLKEYICFIKQIQQNTTIRLLKFYFFFKRTSIFIQDFRREW